MTVSHVWKNQSVDLPVTVIELLGKGSDGRIYVKIQESSTAVPMDELTAIVEPKIESSRKPKVNIPLFRG